MLLAFVSACLTRQHARVQLRMNHFVGRLGLAHEQTGRDRANVSTIEVRPDTPFQFCHVVRFVQARIRAGRTNLRAQRQGIEGLRIMLRMLEVWMGMASKHRLNEIHPLTYSSFVVLPWGNRPRSG
jgi:hypothetical protein